MPAPAMRALALVLLLTPVSLLAAPAPWYRWQSTLDGQVTCQQSSPGPGWELVDGTPYRDLRCTQPMMRMTPKRDARPAQR